MAKEYYSFAAKLQSRRKRDNNDAAATAKKIYGNLVDFFLFLCFFALVPGNAQNKIYVRRDNNFIFSWGKVIVRLSWCLSKSLNFTFQLHLTSSKHSHTYTFFSLINNERLDSWMKKAIQLILHVIKFSREKFQLSEES